MELILLCHAATRAMKTACFPSRDDDIDQVAGDARAALAHRFAAGDARVIASPARAARKTARWISRAHTVDPAFDDLDYGHWQGQSIRDIGERAPQDIAAWLSDPHARAHGGESIAMLAERVADALARVAREQASASRCIVVTHAIVVKAALAHTQHEPLASIFTMDFAPLSSVVVDVGAELRARL